MVSPRLLVALLTVAAGCVPALQPPPRDDSRGKERGPAGELPGSGDACAGLSCPLGCSTALRRCLMLLPKNLASPEEELLAASTKAKLTGAVTVDTDTGEIRDGGQVVRRAGSGIVDGIHWSTPTQGSGYPELAVFVLRSLELTAAATLTVTGKRALLLYLLEDSQLAGTLTAAAAGRAGGPGGYAGGVDGAPPSAQPAASCSGGEGQPGGDGPKDLDGDGGGGGGGFGAAGGAGGDSDFVSKPAGGAAGGASSEEGLSPLRGGCGGGAGGGPETGNSPPGEGGRGGGGGGAVQIAVNGTLQISGVISLPGAGGDGGTSGAGGGGGGAGGGLLLEALELAVTGTLAVNGGGGGAGAPGPGSDGQPGQNGQPSLTPASGGKADGAYGGAGGQGGTAAKLEGSKPAPEANAGGGGGGAGRIRIVSRKPVELGAAKISGKQSAGSTLASW